ncbi:MAG: metallophosphoesterase family protein [Planctomycetia bacterium]|nr:metallophosphoesterase family protein [Planctomycetia bacterium]
MKIGIISDTHDRLDRTLAGLKLLQDGGAEALIHCGDLTGPEIVSACGVLPGWYVFGNNDYDPPMMRLAMKLNNGTSLEWGGEVELGGKRIAVTHGHLHKDVRRLLAAQPHYLLSGHSHIAADEMHDGVRRINPGALVRADRYTVALLDLATDDLKFLEVPR